MNQTRNLFSDTRKHSSKLVLQTSLRQAKLTLAHFQSENFVKRQLFENTIVLFLSNFCIKTLILKSGFFNVLMEKPLSRLYRNFFFQKYKHSNTIYKIYTILTKYILESLRWTKWEHLYQHNFWDLVLQDSGKKQGENEQNHMRKYPYSREHNPTQHNHYAQWYMIWLS